MTLFGWGWVVLLVAAAVVYQLVVPQLPATMWLFDVGGRYQRSSVFPASPARVVPVIWVVVGALAIAALALQFFARTARPLVVILFTAVGIAVVGVVAGLLAATFPQLGLTASVTAAAARELIEAPTLVAVLVGEIAFVASLFVVPGAITRRAARRR